MEKFSAWRDKGTGITPFIPASAPKSAAPAVLLRWVLFGLKLPFLLVFLTLFAVSGVAAFGSFVVKFLFNFKCNSIKPLDNDFVVTNYSSPLTGLILKLLHPNCVILLANSKGELVKVSLWTVAAQCFDEDFDVSGPKLQKTAELNGKVVFCLLEGTPSNNKAVLKFVTPEPKLDFSECTLNLKSLVLRISPSEFNLPIPVVSKFGFLLRLLTNLNNKSSIAMKLIPHDSFDLSLPKAAFRNAGLNPVNLSIEDKKAFYKYYKENA